MPNIGILEHRRLLAIEKRYQELRDKEMITPFAHALSEALGTLAANTAYSEWPEQFRAAFRHVKTKMPAAAEMYLARLPEAK